MNSTPAAEIIIDIALVQRLLAAQHPELADLPLEPADAGWDNAMFRLGDRWCVRLPRRARSAPQLLVEQRWLPSLSFRLPILVPAPVRIGQPGEGYPWAWSVLPWIEGTTADLAPVHEGQACPLAHFLRALHNAAPADAPTSEVRGAPLSRRAALVEERLQRLESKTGLITPAVRRVWRRALEAPPHTEDESTWIHGDLHARTVLVDDRGVISGIIDWGDMARGDKATDLACLWMLLPNSLARRAAVEAYVESAEALWARAMGWAVLFGALLLENGLHDHPPHARMGEFTLKGVAADAT